MTTSWQSIIRSLDSPTRTLLLERLIKRLIETGEITYSDRTGALTWTFDGSDILLPF